MTEYIAYYRVSTDRQGKSGLGLEAQKRDIVMFLEKLTEFTGPVIAEFTDIESGRDNDRPELQKAIALAKETKAVLLVSTLCRLSRRVSFIATLMEDKRLTFRVCEFPDADEFMLHLYAILAHKHARYISEKTKSALEAARARGVKLGGIRPRTAAMNEAKSLIAKAEAEKLRQIVLPLRSAGKTLLEVCTALNTQGHLTPRNCQWTPTQVRRVIGRLEAS